MFKKILLAASIIMFSSAAQSEGGYVGVSVGNTDVDIPGFDDGSSFALTGGYRINQNFAFEVSYIDLGKSDDNIDPVWTIESDGINFAAVGIIPVNEKIEVFGKVGLYVWDVSVSEAGFGEFYSESGSDVNIGFGVSANISENFDLVFEYQKFEVDDEDLSNTSLGARISF